MVFRSGFGAVIIADGELASTTETTTFEDIEFFCRCMTMWRIAGTRRNTHERRCPTRNRIIGKHLCNHTRSNVEPRPLRGHNKGESFSRRSRGHGTSKHGPQKVPYRLPARPEPGRQETSLLREGCSIFVCSSIAC